MRAAPLQLDAETRSAGCARIQRVRRAWLRKDPPSGRGRRGGSMRRVGQQQRRCRSGFGSEAQAAGRNRPDGVGDAHCERQASRLQPLFHGPQQIGSPSGFDQDHHARIEPHAQQAGPVRKTELPGHPVCRAPENAACRRAACGMEAAYGQAHDKARRRRPVADGGARLDLVDGARIEPRGAEPRIDLDRAQRPGPVLACAPREDVTNLRDGWCSGGVRDTPKQVMRRGAARGLYRADLGLQPLDDGAGRRVCGLRGAHRRGGGRWGVGSISRDAKPVRRNGEGQLTVPALTGPGPDLCGVRWGRGFGLRDSVTRGAGGVGCGLGHGNALATACATQ